jgi:UDP-N-acetylglucosamine 3-dehydrogenase
MTISVAVIGVGMMGKNHARVYREIPDIELVAIVDRDQKTAEKIGRLYRVPFYTDVHEMIDRHHPEAVSVVVPTNKHYPVVLNLLQAGCHVLVEKPIASSVEEAEEMVLAAEQLGRILMVGHIERYNPAIIELKGRLERNELGRVFQIHARRLSPFPVRINDVGIMMDLGIHDLDIMRYLIGKEVLRVYSEAKITLKEQCEDLFVSTLRFTDSTIGLLEINWLTPAKIRELYVTGERGMFKVNYLTQDLFFFENADTSEIEWSHLSLLRGVSEGSITQYALKRVEPLRAELESFISKVRKPNGASTNCRDAIKALELVLALSRSAITGEVQEINSDGSTRDTAPSRPDQTISRDRASQPSSIPTG